MPIFRRLTLTLLTLAFLHTGAVGCAAQNFEDRILWDDDGDFAIFLPESQTKNKDLVDLPIHEDDKNYIQYVEQVLNDPFEQKPRCSTPGTGSPPGSLPGAEELEGLIAAESVAITGRVADIVFGWNLQTGHPGHLVYLWIESVITDKAGQLQKGDYAAYAIDGGSLFLGDVELCRKPQEGTKLPEVGEDFLLIGMFWPDGEPPYVIDPIVLPIRDGMIEMRPHPRLLTFEDRPLQRVLHEARQGGPQ